MFTGLRWQPASAGSDHADEPLDADQRGAITERAAVLGLPIAWPQGRTLSVPRAMRVASLAAERGVGGPFVLAAARLAFCGNYNIDDPETLAEAAAVARLDLDDMLDAARDDSRDAPIQAAGRRLLKAGADRLPAVRIGRLLFCGEARLPEAAAAYSTVYRPSEQAQLGRI